jgi:CheY-like chemotaxis protein
MARILVVEDNPLNLKLVRVILESAGHEVEPAVDAEQAEERLARHIPDLILMDLGLPGKDGYTFTRELRARSETRRTPIVALTAYAMKGDMDKAWDAGCTDYLTKPIRGADLVRRLAQWLPAPRGERAAPAQDGRRPGAPAKEP